MATLGTMRARIARELQIDATTFATEIDAAIYTAIARYNDKDFWFLDTTQAVLTISSTTQYTLSTVVPSRSKIKNVQIQINQSRELMYYRTPEEMLVLDDDDNYTGDPLYWTVENDRLHVQPRPDRTRTAYVHFTARYTLTASASASGVWTNEAEELIRLTAEIDILENRLMDYPAAQQKHLPLRLAKAALDEKTVMRKSQRRLKPWL